MIDLRSTGFFRILLAGVLIGVSGISGLAAADEIPERPELGLLDGASILSPPIEKATERLLSEHESATLERISILTLEKSPPGDFEEYSRDVAEAWRKTAPRPPSSILIVVDSERGDLSIRTGLGLDPVLPAARAAEIRKVDFKPEWKSGRKQRALVLSFVAVLKSIGSPLLDDDEAIRAYESAGFSGGWTPAPPPSRSGSPWVFLLLGLAATVFVLVRILIGEVHYTAAGWYPVPASRNLRRLFRRRKRIGSLVTGGGVSGSY